MNVKVVQVKVRVPEDVKIQAEEIYEQLGIDLSTAINVFLKKSIMAGGFPFSMVIEKPNALTKKVIEETEKGMNVDRFNNLDDLWKDLDV